MFRPDRLIRVARLRHVPPPSPRLRRSLITNPIAPLSPDPHQFGSLLRALLRESTYLPDPQAREHFHAYIVARFRRYRGSTRSAGPGPNYAQIQQAPAKLYQLQIEARKELSLLKRANDCCDEAFDEVLARAYGRRGPLRQQWLAPYLYPDQGSDAAAKARPPSDPLAGLRPVDPRLLLPSAIRALAEAQVQQRSHLAPHDQIRHVDPTIPQTNTWDRPMPIVRVANKKINAQRLVLRKVLPPIPSALWNRLNLLVQNRCASMIDLPKRRYRPRGEGLPPLHKTPSEDPQSDSFHSALRSLPRLRSSGDSQQGCDYTTQFLYRRYRKLLPQCAIIRKHPEKPGQWQVTYGSLDRHFHRIKELDAVRLEWMGIQAGSKGVKRVQVQRRWSETMARKPNGQ